MIKKSLQLAAVAALLGAVAMPAMAHSDPYAVDQRGVVARSNYDLCWRSGFWTPAAAAESQHGCACDPDLMPKGKCSGTPGKPGSAAGPRPSADKITVAADALFDFDKAVLRPEGKAKLDELAGKAKAVNLEVILAVGHADRLGKASYNQALSEKRAAAVKTYLVSKGIDANRVYTEGKGSAQPKTGDSCKGMGAENFKNKKLVDCLQPDRRVDIEVIGTK